MAEKRKVLTTIRGQVYKILRDEICAGEYAPGSWLQEVDLAAHLGVSRSPVREALRQLVADGLVVEVPNRGVFVKEFTEKDIDEIFDMRIMLESYGIRHSRENMTSAKLNNFLEVQQKLEDSFRAGDIEEYTRQDSRLHTMIVDIGGNSLVNSTYERVDSMNRQFRILSLTSKKRFDESLDEHREVVHAIIVGDVERAIAVNARHLGLARDTIKERLKEQEIKKPEQ